jgi:subtilisin-like proprotein convertase family protein
MDTTITRTFRGDLVIQVISPTGEVATLSNRSGGSADSFVANRPRQLGQLHPSSSPPGTWRLFVRDLAASDTGTINSFALHITATTDRVRIESDMTQLSDTTGHGCAHVARVARGMG